MTTDPPRQPDPSVVAGAVLLFAVVLQRAWVTDDAYLTFRTIDQFLAGNGLTWNADERVQAFTHPLWLLLHLPFVALTGEVFFTTIVLSLFCTVGAYVVVASRVPGVPALALAAGLALSKSFCDFGTSGLENPLSFLLVAVFLGELGAAARPGRLAFWVALATLNRMDLVLLYLPALVWIVARSRDRATVVAMLRGFWPVYAWEAFSLVYYGSLFPCTYYAKLSTGIPAADYLAQGFIYAVDLVRRDPAGAVLLVGGLAAGVATTRDRTHLAAVAVGTALYALYVVRVGGDFMSGRFWSVPIFVACSLLAQSVGATSVMTATAWGAMALLFPRAASLEAPEKSPQNGIADERLAYEQTNALDWFVRDGGPDSHRQARDGAVARREGAAARAAGHWFVVGGVQVGMLGYYAGPDVLIVDAVGLGDPLLARLPLEDPTSWRVGHYSRFTPKGYFAYRSNGTTTDLDRDLLVYLEALRRITTGALFDPDRLEAILAINTGSLDHHLAAYTERRRRFRPAKVDEEASRTADSIGRGHALTFGAVTPKAPGAGPAVEESAPEVSVVEPDLPSVADPSIEPATATAPAGTESRGTRHILSEAASPKPDGTRWNAPGNFPIEPGGFIEFLAVPPVRGTTIEMSADGNDVYRLALFSGNAELGVVTIERRARGPGLTTRTTEIPKAAAGKLIDRIVVTAEGDKALSVGHLLLR